MARIPDSELDRLKREVSLERLVEAQGIALARHGADLLGLCPFHQDREPSLVVSPKKNLWHCLGACQTGGSVIDWVMRSRGVSFRHAAELLRNDHPALFKVAAAPAPIVTRGTTAAVKLDTPFEADADDQRVLRQVADTYHETLKQSPEALKYLASRGLTHPEMIAHFKLGFANRTLGYRLPDKNRKSGAEIRGRLQRLGILRESGHEHFAGSVVIPVFDLDGNVTGMYGRKITPNLREGTPLHLYLPGPHRGVWNELALQVSKEIVLCESLIDALTFWCAGFRHVTASYGAGGFTDDHRAAFRKHGVARVWIAYDRDEAGEKAAASLSEELLAMGIECFRVLFPLGCDANEYALKVTPAAKSLELALNKAEWLGKGKWPVVSGQWSDGVDGANLSGPESLGGCDRSGAGGLPALEEAPARGELRTGGSDSPGGGVDPGEHRGGPGAAAHAGVRAIPVDRQGQPCGVGYAADHSRAPELSEGRGDRAHPVEDSGDPNDAPRPLSSSAAEALTTDHWPLTTGADEVALSLGDRRYRIRGLGKNLSYSILRVNLLASRGDGFHVDTLDLYAARQRAVFIKQAAIEMAVTEDAVKHDLHHVLRKLEELQDRQIQTTLEPKQTEVSITAEDRAAALDLLEDPRLLDRILEDFTRCGVVGEETNKLVGYIAAVSRSLEAPLAVMLQSSSAAGKSSLMESILAFVPEEHRVEYSAMTGQSLFYMGEQDLKHKVLAIVEEEGASRAAYALKLLQSEGALSIASTGKDPATGRLVTHQYRVEGPVMIFLTTTAIDLDEELLNRCLVLTVNEDREQTQAIHRLQREQQTLEGLLAREERAAVLKVHRNAQRLLQPLFVANPYARELTFLDSRTRMRRDHTKYLTLIRAIALLHQHQRPVKTTVHRGRTVAYIEVTLSDIEIANRLAHEVLGRSLDELPPQTRRLLLLIDDAVARECRRLKIERADFRFSRRDVRGWSEWGDTVLKKHLGRLEDLEYLLVHRGGRGQSMEYELLFVGGEPSSKPRLPGLIDVYDLKKSHLEGEKSPSSRPQVAPKSPPSRGEVAPAKPA